MVVVVGGAMVVVVGAVVVGVAHGSTGAGACCTDADSGLPDGVGAAGVVLGCANAPAVPETNTSATVPAVNSDLDAERIPRRGGRRDLDEIVVMDVLRSRRSGSDRAADSILNDNPKPDNTNRKESP
ncbi:hypothetical protein CH275_09885 [Rhodococcus sp. 06-235-1A]|nr:hypothetical protein CH275_09885 [Rhodococcus sp. 06-235-1A]